MIRFFKKFSIIILFIVIVGYLIPNNISSPIELSSISQIDPESFWYYPWGKSGVHKGIDIFCEENTDVISPVAGFVISKGYGTISGNYLYLIGPKWRTYYFAHLNSIDVSLGEFVNRGDIIGKTGNTGNALNAPTHLHFSIGTIFPYFWLYDSKHYQGWKKMFYLDPIKELPFDVNKDSFLTSSPLNYLIFKHR